MLGAAILWIGLGTIDELLTIPGSGTQVAVTFGCCAGLISTYWPSGTVNQRSYMRRVRP